MIENSEEYGNFVEVARNSVMTWKARHVAGIVAVLGAAIVAASGHDGWRWLLFFAAFVCF